MTSRLVQFFVNLGSRSLTWTRRSEKSNTTGRSLSLGGGCDGHLCEMREEYSCRARGKERLPKEEELPQRMRTQVETSSFSYTESTSKRCNRLCRRFLVLDDEGCRCQRSATEVRRFYLDAPQQLYRELSDNSDIGRGDIFGTELSWSRATVRGIHRKELVSCCQLEGVPTLHALQTQLLSLYIWLR